MDEQYDVIVLGTGLVECVLSGLLSVEGRKVLHLDRNPYYGGECASLNLEQLFRHAQRDPPPEGTYGRPHQFNVDLAAKLLMANGRLVRILSRTVAQRYEMQFTQIEGSYVVRGGRPLKVPATDVEALKTSLVGFFEKRRLKNFLEWVHDYDEKKPNTHKGMDLRRVPMAAVFQKFSLEERTVEFVGHAIALHTSNAYLGQPAYDTVMKLKLYAESVSAFGQSPYVYPLYGLGDIPQAFARLCAVYNGTYMLNKPVSRIIFDDDGGFAGVESEGEIARAPVVVGDPTYFVDTGKVRKVERVVRCICLMTHPIPGIESKTCQIIYPSNELRRRHDIYIIILSNVQQVVPERYFLALVSTTVETDNPHAELEPGIRLLGEVRERFYSVSEVYVPLADGTADRCYISRSLDATTHFETASVDLVDLYRRITGGGPGMSVTVGSVRLT